MYPEKIYYNFQKHLLFLLCRCKEHAVTNFIFYLFLQLSSIIFMIHFTKELLWKLNDIFILSHLQKSTSIILLCNSGGHKRYENKAVNINLAASLQYFVPTSNTNMLEFQYFSSVRIITTFASNICIYLYIYSHFLYFFSLASFLLFCASFQVWSSRNYLLQIMLSLKLVMWTLNINWYLLEHVFLISLNISYITFIFSVSSSIP